MRYLSVALIMLMFACGKKEQEAPVGETPTSPPAVVNPEESYRYEIIAGSENTFGYDIYKNDAMFIHQPHIPGVAGVKGFGTETQAGKAAALMIEKMKQGVVPPTLSQEEIDAIIKN